MMFVLGCGNQRGDFGRQGCDGAAAALGTPGWAGCGAARAEACRGRHSCPAPFAAAAHPCTLGTGPPRKACSAAAAAVLQLPPKLRCPAHRVSASMRSLAAWSRGTSSPRHSRLPTAVLAKPATCSQKAGHSSRSRVALNAGPIESQSSSQGAAASAAARCVAGAARGARRCRGAAAGRNGVRSARGAPWGITDAMAIRRGPIERGSCARGRRGIAQGRPARSGALPALRSHAERILWISSFPFPRRRLQITPALSNKGRQKRRGPGCACRRDTAARHHAPRRRRSRTPPMPRGKAMGGPSDLQVLLHEAGQPPHVVAHGPGVVVMS